MGMAKMILGESPHRLQYAGPISSEMLLITVDVHSKWIEAQVVSSALSQSTIDHLRTLFATY